MRLVRALVPCSALALIALWPATARAQPADAPELTPVPPAPAVIVPLRDPPVLPWSLQPERWFVSSEIDTGFLYVRPRFSTGYGRPHDLWVGLDANPIFSSEGIAGYLGLRFDLPLVNLRVGGRYWYTFRRSFLVPEESYSVEDIELQEGPPSRFLTWEAELSTNVPLGRGALLAEGSLSLVTGVADDYYVYEETLRVVVDPPWVWRGRIGYTFAIDDDRTIVLGPVLEFVGVPKRDVVVYRAGALARVFLSPTLEARGTFVPAVYTPDPLGARGGDAFLLGIRWRWATGP
ncbi:MAG TPA: hypothetical protein VMG12_14935 [Polyangiaceae bacterium]|nr:hypothetical protein [Polyangiaceae bacterium]